MRRHRFSRPTLLIALLAIVGMPTGAYAVDGGDMDGRGADGRGVDGPAVDGRRDRPNRQGRRDDNAPPHNHQRDLSDAVRRIERERGGQVLSAEPMEYEGRQVNRIKMVDDRGRVRVIMDDPHKPTSDGKPRDD